MESKSSYLSSKGTSISSTACVSCRRCLHHRRHHHRVRFTAALDNHDDGHTTITASMNGDNQENQQSIMRDSCLLAKRPKEEDDACRQNRMMKQAAGMCEVDSSGRKTNYFNNISSFSRSLTTTEKSISLISEKGQLDETRICQQYFFSKERIGESHHERNNRAPQSAMRVPHFVDKNPCYNITPKYHTRNKHVTFTLSLKNFKMLTVLVQIAALSTFLAPLLLFPTCQASDTGGGTNNETHYQQHLVPSSHDIAGESNSMKRFNISRQSNHRMATTSTFPSSSATSKLLSEGWKTATLPIDPSIHSTKMNGDNGNKNNNHEHGREHTRNSVNRNLSQENGDERSETSRKPVTMKGKSASVGIPFVRAHSTGFISLADDDESTEGSSLSTQSSGSTLGRNLMTMTQHIVGMFGIGGEDSSSKLLTIGPCLCWNTTSDGQTREVECKCTGEEMTNIVKDLPADIDRLTVEQAANFTTLSNDDLKLYGNTLNELVLSELPAFQNIKNGTFLGMKRLNTIYIHGTPALTQISDTVFNVYLPELKIIRITHSSLEVVPNLSQLHIRGAALHMVEFENNKISQLMPGSFKGLTTEHLALSYNDLEEIGPSAFAGSTIARLTLKGNPLKVLHSESFVGIDSLRVLDLSETKITYLPTQGLSGLESLRLEKVWTLSVIPSIYHFQELEEAWLTWPYHCCAFDNPETHDPMSFQKYREYVRSVVNELCARANGSVGSTEFPQDNNDETGHTGAGRNTTDGFHNDMDELVRSQRHKRHLRLFEQANVLRSGSHAGSSRVEQRQRKMARSLSLSSSEYNLNGRRRREVFRIRGNTQQTYKNNIDSNYFPEDWDDKHVSNERDIFLEDMISKKLLVSTITSNVAGNGGATSRPTNRNVVIGPRRYPGRLAKRSANGNHRRQAEKLGENDEDKKGKYGTMSRDGFHHPHVLHGSNGGGVANPPHHPFDSGDGPVLHYGKMKPGDSFDPFVFDPDQSFAPILDPNDREHESDIMGKDTWGTFGHASEAEFDEDIGIFHPSVTPSPTVITLCGNVAVKKPPKITCHPLPDAFNPCEDIMGSIWLRGAVWVVVALALFGNTAVLVVLLLAPGRISVQRFLMANLSWADLCMGIYLLMVATQDLVSLGSYFNYAIDWQLGWGCQIAGFLTVFASELSVFTLAVITGERWYALTRAIHLTKRLTLLGAAQLMAFGWFMAILLAALPLMGVSSYSKTSICLPMEGSSGGAVAYLIFLLLFNGVAFLLVAYAYCQMYRAVAGHGRPGNGAAPATSSADTAIAKKMALLVFTDFACWAPVAFFGLTAVGGMPLIGVTDSKILLVFFYPLNACCNPYLYAILTKQYRRDLLLLLSRKMNLKGNDKFRHGLCTKRAARYKTGAASTNNTMQTMQTVLRMGSMTETKVAGSGGGGRGSVLVNGGRPSVVGCNNSLKDEELLLMSNRNPAGTSLSQNKVLNKEQPKSSELQSQANILDHPLQVSKQHHNSISLKSSCEEDFKKALNLHPPPMEDDDDDDDDVFDMNGLSGRHLAETTFISIPASMSTGGNGTNAKKVNTAVDQVGNGDPAKQKLIQHVVEQHGHQQQQQRLDKKSSPCAENAKLTNIPLKEEHDLEHEITEMTPFCA